jgi:hypothetical protein
MAKTFNACHILVSRSIHDLRVSEIGNFGVRTTVGIILAPIVCRTMLESAAMPLSTANAGQAVSLEIVCGLTL